MSDFSQSVSTSSEEITNEAKEGSKQIALTMEELASGAETQATGPRIYRKI